MMTPEEQNEMDAMLKTIKEDTVVISAMRLEIERLQKERHDMANTIMTLRAHLIEVRDFITEKTKT